MCLTKHFQWPVIGNGKEGPKKIKIFFVPNCIKIHIFGVRKSATPANFSSGAFYGDNPAFLPCFWTLKIYSGFICYNMVTFMIPCCSPPHSGPVKKRSMRKYSQVPELWSS